jgi:ABC-type multidrug transport system ATPase subunit
LITSFYFTISLLLLGSGKSSLLNVLAGRSASAPGIEVSGDVTVEGVPIDPVAYRRNIAYVMQDDALMATTTPREALRFSAALRRNDVTILEINDLVEATLKALGIEECADTWIGNALIKGISGGQRKRTSVGIELITNPSLFFLDEPTSGLDSYTSYSLLKVLRKIAASNATVLCTIHQPSSEVFHLFDSAIFLKAGRILYQGPINEIAARFNSIGYPCQINTNPADHVMFITQTESMEALENAGAFIPPPASDHASATKTISNDVASASPFVQMQWLLQREFRNTFRNYPALMGRFGVTIILNLIFGMIFLDVGKQNNANQNNFQAHFGVIVMTMISAMFGAAQPTLLEFPFERPMFMREYSVGTYTAIVYSLSKLCTEIPILLVQCIVQMILIYFMAGLRGNYFALLGAAFGTGLASSSVAVMLGCLVPDPKQAQEMMPLVLVPQILFVGFFIRTSQIPVWLRWAQYLCSLKYGINIMIINEFASNLPSCDGEAADECRQIHEANNIYPEYVWVYILILAALFLGFRVTAMVLLAKKAVRFY